MNEVEDDQKEQTKGVENAAAAGKNALVEILGDMLQPTKVANTDKAPASLPALEFLAGAVIPTGDATNNKLQSGEKGSKVTPAVSPGEGERSGASVPEIRRVQDLIALINGESHSAMKPDNILKRILQGQKGIEPGDDATTAVLHGVKEGLRLISKVANAGDDVSKDVLRAAKDGSRIIPKIANAGEDIANDVIRAVKDGSRIIPKITPGEILRLLQDSEQNQITEDPHALPPSKEPIELKPKPLEPKDEMPGRVQDIIKGVEGLPPEEDLHVRRPLAPPGKHYAIDPNTGYVELMPDVQTLDFRPHDRDAWMNRDWHFALNQETGRVEKVPNVSPAVLRYPEKEIRYQLNPSTGNVERASKRNQALTK